MFSEAVLLGLSTGTYCAMYCAPVAIPFLFSEDMNRRQNIIYVSLFMFGRLLGYIIVGAVLGAIGAYAVSYLDPELQRKSTAIAYTFIGLIMLLAGLKYNFPGWKLCKVFKKIYKPEGGALVYGLLTGINLCPPFFAAASRVFGRGGNAANGALFFLLFFAGTSLYFLPLFGIHLIGKHLKTIRMISRLLMIVLGVYFFLFLGFLTIL